ALAAFTASMHRAASRRSTGMPSAMLAATSRTCRSPSEHGSTPCTASAAAAKSTAATWRSRNTSQPASTATSRKSWRSSQVRCPLNVALHGLEEAAGVRYRTSGTRAGDPVPGSPVAVRYADDVVVLCHNQEQAAQVKARLAEWLAPRGLAFNEDKTKIVRLDE